MTQGLHPNTAVKTVALYLYFKITTLRNQPPMRDNLSSNLGLHFYTFKLLIKDHLSYKGPYMRVSEKAKCPLSISKKIRLVTCPFLRQVICVLSNITNLYMLSTSKTFIFSLYLMILNQSTVCFHIVIFFIYYAFLHCF